MAGLGFRVFAIVQAEDGDLDVQGRSGGHRAVCRRVSGGVFAPMPASRAACTLSASARQTKDWKLAGVLAEMGQDGGVRRGAAAHIIAHVEEADRLGESATRARASAGEIDFAAESLPVSYQPIPEHFRLLARQAGIVVRDDDEGGAHFGDVCVGNPIATLAERMPGVWRTRSSSRWTLSMGSADVSWRSMLIATGETLPRKRDGFRRAKSAP